MSSMLLKIVIFSICINLATGIVLQTTDADGNKIFSNGTANLMYKEGYGSNIINYSSGDVTPVSDVHSGTLWILNVFDYFGLGYINKFLSILNDYMYGFINLLENISVALMMPETMSTILFGGLKLFLTILYVITGIQLFLPGRNISHN